jgi:SAM-dependent methyltransferase
MFSGLGRVKKGVFRNVVLHSLLEQRFTGSTEKTKADLRAAGFGTDLAKATTAKLRSLVAGLDVGRKASAWSEYRGTCSYSDADAGAKRDFVEAAAAELSPPLVLDLGCNDGEYSLLAAEHAGYVVAVDADQESVDRLYRRLRAAGPAEGRADVLPLVMNLTDPSGGLGWRNRERAPFADRVRPDLTLALALVHHLAIGNNVPLPAVATLFARMAPHAIVEFVPKSDPMTRRLLASRRDIFDAYTIDGFRSAFSGPFETVREAPIADSPRTLFLLRRRATDS